MKNSQKKPRVWELDALRGLLLIGLLITHIMACTEELCRNAYNIFGNEVGNAAVPHLWLFSWNPKLMIWEEAWITKFFRFIDYPAVCCFFIVSGISCVFSRNNFKSGLRLLTGAAFVSLFTWILTIVTGDKGQFIRFGALHCYALCHLIYYFLLEGKRDRVLLIVAAASLAFGIYLRFIPIQSEFALLVPFGIREYGAIHRDYWPVFPMLGWFLIGVVLGKRFYSKKETLFPGQADRKWHRPICFLGRYSGLIYCGHMVVYTLVFCGIGYIFDLY